MKIGYRIVQRFTPAWDGWAKYVDWSGLSHLEEVVGLDCSLCPSVLQTYVDDDMEHLAFAERLFACFDDQEYATRRMHEALNADLHQILALAREPSEEELIAMDLPGFRFMGFDLIEEATCISALTNCRGFEGAFLPTDLSAQGLVPAAARAYEIRRSLGTLFPDEPHADCAVWAVWRRETSPGCRVGASASSPKEKGREPKPRPQEVQFRKMFFRVLPVSLPRCDAKEAARHNSDAWSARC